MSSPEHRPGPFSAAAHWWARRTLAGTLRAYPWTCALLAALGVAGTALFIQFPFGFYSPDIGYHAAKILRASEGDYFLDPFSGTPTIYPALFHTLQGLVLRWTGLDTFTLYRMGNAVNFLFILGAFFLLARVVTQSTERASAATLTLGLLFYAPSARYILLFYPANFSLGLLLLGLAIAFRHLHTPRPVTLAVGLFLQGVAAVIWWFASVVSLVFLGAAALHAGRTHHEHARRHLLLGAVSFLLPWGFLLAQVQAVGTIAADYQDAPQPRPLNITMLGRWALTVLDKGNAQFTERILPWNWSSLETSLLSVPPGLSRYLLGLVAFVHFFVLVVPYNLLLLGVAAGSAFRKRMARARGDTPDLALAVGWLIILLSLPMLVVGNLDHVRRVQFVAFALFLLYVFTRDRRAEATPGIRVLIRLGPIMGVLALGYTIVYTTRIFPREPTPETGEIVRFIESLPDHRNQRVFFVESSVRLVSPFVTFTSFVGHRHGVYYYQDVVSARRLYDHYLAVVERRPNWRQALDAEAVRFIVLQTEDSLEAALAAHYEPAGDVALKNSRWVVLDMCPAVPPRTP